MHDYYELARASITTDYITARRAHELYAEAKSEPEADLHGDLETGFEFWIFHAESNLKLVHFRVTPVHTDEVPEDVRERLATPPTPSDASNTQPPNASNTHPPASTT